MTNEDPYKEFKDKNGNYISCPICGSSEHTDGRCESGTQSWEEEC